LGKDEPHGVAECVGVEMEKADKFDDLLKIGFIQLTDKAMEDAKRATLDKMKNDFDELAKGVATTCGIDEGKLKKSFAFYFPSEAKTES